MSAVRNLTSGFRRVVCIAAAAVLLATAALAQTPTVQEETKVKAAFLLRFAQFVAWPHEALPQGDSPLVVGITGSDAIASELTQQAATSRATLGRQVIVRNAKRPEDVAAVHLLFIGADERARIPQYANAVRSRNVLLVTESEGALEHGSMINFVIAERRVKFEIALDTAEKAGLVLSSRLLAVAMRVLKGELRKPALTVASAAPARAIAGAGE